MKDGLNSYIYVHNRPLKLIDPTGFTAEDPHPLDGLPGHDGNNVRKLFGYQRPTHQQPVFMQDSYEHLPEREALRAITHPIAYKARRDNAKLSGIIVPETEISEAGPKVAYYLNKLIGDKTHLKFVAYHSGQQKANVRIVSQAAGKSIFATNTKTRSTQFWQLGYIEQEPANPPEPAQRMALLLEDIFNGSSYLNTPIDVHLVNPRSQNFLSKVLGATTFTYTEQREVTRASIAVSLLPEPIIMNNKVKGSKQRNARARVATILAHELVVHVGTSLLTGQVYEHSTGDQRDQLTVFDNLVIVPSWNSNHPSFLDQVDEVSEYYDK